jgi:hypothetical protein
VIFRKLPFVSGRLSGTSFNPYVNVPLWVRAIFLALRNFKIFAHGRLLDLNQSGFITCWTKTSSTSFGFCTANEMLNVSSNMREPSDAGMVSEQASPLPEGEGARVHFRIEGVLVMPTSRPSGPSSRVTTWPQGSFCVATSSL